MPKATMSKDGKLRFNIRVSHRLGRDWLSCLLCHRLLHDEELPNGRNQLFDWARRELEDYGEERVWYWSDPVLIQDQEQIEEQVDLYLDQYFPELYEGGN